MIEINLVPESFYRAKRLRKILAVAIGGGILGAAIMVLLYAFTLARVTILNNEISMLEREQKIYEKTLAEIENINKKTKMVDERIKSINDLQEQQVAWILMMDEFGRSVPNNLWISSLTNKMEGGGFRTFSCDGISLFKEVIADFLIKINTGSCFRNAVLISYTEISAVGLKAYSFRISFQSVEEAKLRPPKQIEINSVAKTGIEGVTYINKEFNCSLSRIENWLIADKTPLSNLLCVITREKKQLSGRFSPNVSLAVENVKKPFASSKEYAQSIEAMVKKTFSGYAKFGERELIINDLKCYEVTITYKTSSSLVKGKTLDLKQRRIYFIKNGVGYVVCCTDVQSGFDKSREDFESIINSFKVL